MATLTPRDRELADVYRFMAASSYGSMRIELNIYSGFGDCDLREAHLLLTDAGLLDRRAVKTYPGTMALVYVLLNETWRNYVGESDFTGEGETPMAVRVVDRMTRQVILDKSYTSSVDLLRDIKAIDPAADSLCGT